MRIGAIVVLCLSLCRTAHAEPTVTPTHSEHWKQLTDLRLAIRDERQIAGVVLLGLGLASVAVGTALAVVGREEKLLLAAGVTTASFGAVNAALSFGMLDLSGANAAAIRSAQATGDFTARREAELIAHLHSGQFFAVNAGLDVFYMASGGLLCAIAAMQNENDRWELGAGIALIAQGAWLMAFDIINWINANDRAARFRALGSPTWPRAS